MKDRALLRAIWQTNRLLPIVVLVLLATNLALFFWLAWEKAPQVESQERRFILLQAQGRKGEGERGYPTTLPGIYNRGKKEVAAFRQAMPSKTEFTELIGEILSKAEKAGLSIERISYDPKELKGKGVLQYSLDFSVVGDYSRLKKFIFSLEQSPRLIAVEDISLSERESAAQRGVSLEIGLTTYFRSDQS